MLDVLIVGAGPTGLTLAIELSRRGLAVRIVDRSLGPQQGSRGFGIKPRTMEIFDDFGLAEEFVAATGTVQRTRVYLGGTLQADFTVPRRPPTPARPYPSYVSLPQWRTEEILRTDLARRGVRVDFGTTLTNFTDDGSSVTAEFADGSQKTAAYLVGCDGGRSTVRKLLDIGFEGSTVDARAALADVEVSGMPDYAVHLWRDDREVLVLRPYREEQPWQLVASIGPSEEPTPEWLQRVAAERSGVDSLRISDPRSISIWRYSLRIATQYRKGRVFIAGDAAHVHSPFGAFGLNTGVQDAYNLGWKLAMVRRGADEALLDTYQTERLPVGRSILAESNQRFSAAISPPRILRPALRYLVKPFLVRMNRRGADDHPRYPTSPLTIPAEPVPIWRRRRGMVCPGDTAPDGIGRRPNGERVRMFDLFRGPQFTVLAFGQPVPALSGPVQEIQIGRDVIDVNNSIRRRYPNCSFALIRPDGYVAALTDDAEDLCAYLERWTRGAVQRQMS